MSSRWLLLRLETPLIAFGAVAVDQHGPVQDIPSPSLLAGLIGNALGFDRTEGGRLQRLQQRLDFAVRRDREGVRVADFQTAELGKDDRGWTTRGRPEGRAGGAGTYAGKHIRRRWFDADAAVTVALRLDPADETPTLDAVAAALDRPARALFLGRKPCLPATRLVLGLADAPDALAALAGAALAEEADEKPRVFRPHAGPDAPPPGARRIAGRRDWIAGVHGGEQVWIELRPAAGGGPP